MLNVGNSLTDISITYRYPIICDEYAESVSNTFRNILGQTTAAEDLRLCQLDEVSEQDQQKMLIWDCERPLVVKQEACMHHLVASKAREIPNLEAVCAWDGSLTFSQLEVLASIAARRLMKLGVGPGVYVPFAYDKSLWAVVATLAILKAGGAFVPLNPRDPPERLAEILRNVKADVVVTSENFAMVFESLTKHVEIISSDAIYTHYTDGQTLDVRHPVALDGFATKDVSPSDPIFVLFTSGSTGKPKGMIHEHAAICTHATTHGEAMGYTGARVLQFAAHTFDVAIIDIFTTLIYGGCICIPSEEDRRNNIIEVINKMRVDYAILTPSFAGLLEPSEVPTLKTLAIGGEALPQDRIERWAEKVRFIQIYGPAEVGICLTKDMSPSTAPEDVGHPLASCSCWLVDPDDSDRLIPIGAVGEMIIAGPTLARGYLNDEAKTRVSFIDAPAWAARMGIRHERFYKTGDLLKYNVDSFDGSFCFVGRKDAQIKLRGQRVEPGEVEYHLGRLPNVEVSMVTRPENGCFVGELVAVVQMQRTNGERSRVRDELVSLAPLQSLSLETMREYLSKVLPGYMIPTASLVIESMPFVPSLKIDRRRVSTWLTAMESRPLDLYKTALTRLGPEETLAHTLSSKIAELLAPKNRQRSIALESHDFAIQEAGIDSIQVISLSMWLRKYYQRRIPMNVLLSSRTTVRTLAQLINDPKRISVNGCHFSNGDSSPTAVDFRHEPKILTEALIEDLSAQHSPQSRASGTIEHVFLTGVTGYLGLAILQHLMERSQAHVFTMVRCTAESIGLQRIIDAATLNGWWHDRYISRIDVWLGDLTKPSLGLGEAELDLLSGKSRSRNLCIHAIIHNGAKVHYSSDYETLKAVNVLSTLELLKITASAPHISKFVFVSGGENPNINASAASAAYLEHLEQASGYTQTKFVSEQIVRKCVENTFFQNKDLCIVKPGYIIGSARNGIANQSDFIWRLIAGCLEVGAYNRDEADHWLFIADVNRVADSVVSGAFGHADGPDKQNSGRVDRVLDGLQFSELWEILEGVYEQTFEALGQEEWMSRLREEILSSGEEHLLFPLLHVLERDGGCLGDKASSMSSTPRVKEAFEKNVRYLISVGFLPLPTRKNKAEHHVATAL